MADELLAVRDWDGAGSPVGAGDVCVLLSDALGALGLGDGDAMVGAVGLGECASVTLSPLSVGPGLQKCGPLGDADGEAGSPPVGEWPGRSSAGL